MQVRDKEKGEKMEHVSRRTFVGMQAAAIGTALVGIPTGHALAEEQGSLQNEDANALQANTGTVTPEELLDRGYSKMALEEINRRRRELVDAAGPVTLEDGTEVPAVYSKLHVLLHTFSYGAGKDPKATVEYLMMLMSEDEAQAFLDMPWGIDFTAIDFAEQSGRDVKECVEICEELSGRGLIMRAVRNGTRYYHQIPLVIGSFEYCVGDFYNDGWADTWISSVAKYTLDDKAYAESGTPIEYAIPCDESIVSDEKILVGDDYRVLVENNDVICVMPCACRTLKRAKAGYAKPDAEDLPELYSEVCGHPIETCVGFGEEAQYMIDRGIAREINKDEALEILARSVDMGMITQALYTRNTAWICSCHGDCCGILGNYLAMGPEEFKQSPTYKNVSRYNLNYDKDACVQCGACVERCPLTAIEINADGFPEVTGICMRCGQCGMVCPAHARTLSACDESERPELPADLMDQWTQMAGYRFEKGFLG